MLDRVSTAAVCAGILMAATSVANAQQKIVVLSAEVHRANMRGTGVAAGGPDNLAAFEAKTGTKVDIHVSTSAQLGSAIPRIGMLNRSEEDVAFIVNNITSARSTSYLTPLTDFMAKDPIPGFPENWPKGVVNATTFNNTTYLIPVRCGVEIFWYNTNLMKERGIEKIAKTPEELYEAAKRGTFTRDNGEKIYGFGIPGDKYDLPTSLAVVAGMFGGQIVNAQGEVTVDHPAFIKSIEWLRKLYQEGIMPPNWANVNVEEQFQAGRTTIALGGANYDQRYNNPDALKGAAVPSHVPLVKDLWSPERDYARSGAFYWSVGILKGSTDKQVAYDFIRYLAQPEVQRGMVTNGNGPCTLDLFAELGKLNEGYRIGAETFAISSAALPPHARVAEVADKLSTAVQNIVINGAPAEETLKAVAAEMTRILKS
jgi:ABC-type glycerol-3-phosphate transport system substrate-binding protein